MSLVVPTSVCVERAPGKCTWNGASGCATLPQQQPAEKQRGGFTLISREALLKGGASGEPAIVPGSAAGSTLVRYVTGQIEDLEMPPLDRREKYPALAPAEVDVLRAWIDAGAPWGPVKTVAR